MSTVPNAAEGPQSGAPSPELYPTFAAMRAAPRWLLANPSKTPFYTNGQTRSGTLDAPGDIAQLATYEEAKATLTRCGEGWHLGFALGPDDSGNYWQGIDLDDVRQNGLADIADMMPGYVEISPSGEGAHAIGCGVPFRALGPNGTGVEAYSGGRYFTVTEHPVRDGGSVCLAPFVAEAVASRHCAGRKASPGGSETVSVDDAAKRDLRSALLSMRADTYLQWVQMGMALRELGDVGRGLWMEWSATSDKFDAKQAARKWDGFNPSRTGYQAVFAEAQRGGWLNPGSKAAQGASASAEAPNTAVPLRLLLDANLERHEPLRWLVKNIVPDVGIGAIYGDSGTFKSFLALHMMTHISNGREWFGQRVRAAPAVYVPFEGQGGIPNRIKAWRLAETMQRNPDLLLALEPDADVRSNIAVVMDPLNLRDIADQELLVATLTGAGWAGGILCIDTLAHASAGIEENSSAMGEMLGIFRDLQQRLGGVILLVHHSGKDQSRGMRGWSGLHAAMDFVIECQKEGDGGSREARFRLSKVKDGTTGTYFNFRMEMVPLGCDEDGDPVTSLVVRPIEHYAIDGETPPFKSSDKASIRDINADTSANDDAFIHGWVVQQVLTGHHPSKNSLKGQLPDMKASGYQITQDRVLAAVERLLAESRLAREAKSPNGNVWLRPMDATPSPPGSLA